MAEKLYHLPFDGLVSIFQKIMDENPRGVLCKLSDIETNIYKRGIIRAKDKNGNDVEMVQLTPKEVQFIKYQYETII